jgi:hypothetical protein
MDLFTKRNPEKSRRTTEIKMRIVDLLQHDQEATVMLTELNCQDEECPEVETVVAIFKPGQQKIQVTLHSGIEEITDQEIEHFCRNLQQAHRLSEAPVAGSE